MKLISNRVIILLFNGLLSLIIILLALINPLEKDLVKLNIKYYLILLILLLLLKIYNNRFGKQIEIFGLITLQIVLIVHYFLILSLNY